MPGPRQAVIGYGRVSTEEQESNYSLDAQRGRFEVLCKQNRWQSLGFFQETGSGTSVLNRPVLCNILQRIQQGGVGALWVKETDRLSRPENLGDLSLISQTLESANTLLIVDSRTLDLKEDNSVLMLDFEGVLAKHFRRQLLRNLNRGKTRKAEMGRKAGGADIYGYRTNDDGEYAPHPEQARVVRLMFELVAKDYSLRKISAELAHRGIPSPWGRSVWSIEALGRMLHNDLYIGVYRFQKSKHGKDVDGQRYTIRNRKDQIVVGTADKPNHPPLVDKATFALAQEKLQANRRKTSVRLYMATGLLRCPACGSPMSIRFSTVNRRIDPRGHVEKYACPRARTQQCDGKRIVVKDTNDALWSALVQLLIDPERIRTLIAPTVRTDADTARKHLEVIEREEKSVREKQERLLNLYLEGNIPQASYVVKTAQLEAEASRLTDRKIELRKQLDKRNQKDLTTDLIQTLRILARSHRRLTPEQKTVVFRSIVKEARITSAGVELELYVKPTQNAWWKYRQKKGSKGIAGSTQTIRLIHRQVAQSRDQ